MEFCITARELRKALSEIEQAEAHGFMHCLGVFRIAEAGYMLDACRAEYSDLLERASDRDPKLNWGRNQAVTKRYRFVDGKLELLKDKAA